MVTLALIPSTEPRSPGGGKAGAAVDRLLSSLERATLGATRRAFVQGQGMADLLFAGSEAEPVLEVQSRGTLVPVSATRPATTAVAATETVEPTLTATPRPLPTTSIPLEVGMRVVVRTGGGVEVRYRDSSGDQIPRRNLE